MTPMEQKGISSDRVSNVSGVNVDLLECSICSDILWNPVACLSCETPFCSACINRWLANNPNKCPNRCETYTERKCPPFIIKLLAQLQITCVYQSKGCPQVISYEALDKHEIECEYQPQRCPGCGSEILKKDFDNHTSDCALIQLTCQDCKLVYNRSDAATKHTENICLREQLRQLRDESKENKREIRELNLQLNELRILNPSLGKARITFDDLPTAVEKAKVFPSIYRGLKWTKMFYLHELYAIKNHPNSGYATSFIAGGSPHIVFFKDNASVSIERPNETFTFVSVTASGAWNDDLQLTITGHRNSIQMNTHTATLLFGKPQLILLQWANIDKVNFESSGGIPHPGGRDSGGSQVVFTQVTICQLDGGENRLVP